MTDPRCHGNEIRDKMTYNSACFKVGYSATPNYSNFTTTDLCCHDNKL